MKQSNSKRRGFLSRLDLGHHPTAWFVAIVLATGISLALLGGAFQSSEARTSELPEFTGSTQPCAQNDIACIVDRDWVFFDDFCSRAVERELDKYGLIYSWVMEMPGQRFDAQAANWINLERQIASIPGKQSLLVNGKPHDYVCLYTPVFGAHFWASVDPKPHTP